MSKPLKSVIILRVVALLATFVALAIILFRDYESSGVMWNVVATLLWISITVDKYEK